MSIKIKRTRRVIRDEVIPAVGDTVSALAGTAVAGLTVAKELAETATLMSKGLKADTELDVLEDDVERSIRRAQIMAYRDQVLNADGSLRAEVLEAQLNEA